MALGALIDGILSQTRNDMRKQCEMVNVAFRNKVKEVKDAKHKLETLLAMVSGRGQSAKKWKQWAWFIYQFSQSSGLNYFALRILPLHYWQPLPHFPPCLPPPSPSPTPSHLRFYFLSSVCTTTEVNFWNHSLNISVAVDISKVRTSLVIF